MVNGKQIGVGTSITGVIGLISWFMLSSHFLVEIDLSDKHCAGTFDDPCEAMYNITLKDLPTFYIYNKNFTKLIFEPQVKSSYTCKKDLRYKNKNRRENPCGAGWREFNWDKPLTNQSSYVNKFVRNQKQEFKIVVFKNDIGDKIKWGGKLSKTEFDPDFLPPDGYIGSGNKTWVYEVTFQDELNATIEHLTTNDTGVYFRAWVDSYNDTRTNQGGYKFKIHTNATYINGTLESKTWRVNLNKNDLKKWYYIDFPPNLVSFVGAYGESSTLIDATATTSATIYGKARKLCAVNETNIFAIFDSSAGIGLSNSSNRGNTWNTSIQIIDQTSSNHPQVQCDYNGVVFAQYMYNDNALYIKNSTDLGKTWSAASKVLQTQDLNAEASMVIDSQNRKHYCHVNTTALTTAFYINETATDRVNGATGDDTDHCDIAVGNNDCIYVFGIGTDGDDLDVWSPCLRGWGDARRIEIRNGAVGGGAGVVPSAVMDSRGKFHTCDTIDNVLNYCWSNEYYNNSWQCKVVDASASIDCVIAVTQNNHVVIMYQDAHSIGVNVEVYYANSTDGSNGRNWTSRVQLHTASGLPSIMYQKYPPQNVPKSLIEYVYSDNSADVYFGNRSVPYIENGINITYPLSTNYKNVTAGDIVAINFTLYQDTRNIKTAKPFINSVFIGQVNASIQNISSQQSYGVMFDWDNRYHNLRMTEYEQCVSQTVPFNYIYNFTYCVNIKDRSFESQLDVGDNGVVVHDCTSSGARTNMRLTYRTFEYVRNITQINISWEGLSSASGYNLVVYAWNYTRTNWTQVGNFTVQTTNTLNVTTINTGFTDFINSSGIAQFLFFHTAGAACTLNTISTNSTWINITTNMRQNVEYVNSYWLVNVTVPTRNYLELYPVTINVSWQDLYYNDTQADAFYYPEPLTDTAYPPNLTFVTLNSTSGKNKTTDNLTAWINSTFDLDGDNVSVNINWYENGIPLTILNMPFAHLGTAVYDFSGSNMHGLDTDGITYINDSSAKYLPAINVSSTATKGIIIDDNDLLDLDYYRNWTIELWYYPYSMSDAESVIFSKRDESGTNGGYMLKLNLDVINFSYETDVGVVYDHTPTLQDGIKWYYIAITYNATDQVLKMYVNNLGSFITYNHGSVAFIGQNALNLRIGAPHDSIANAGANGMIDEFRITNRTLTQPQAKANYLNYSNQVLEKSTLRHLYNYSCNATPIDMTGLNGTTKPCINTITIINPCTCPTSYGVTAWNVDGIDNCKLTTECNMQNGTFICSGAQGIGLFNISGSGYLHNMSLYRNGCRVRTEAGGRKRI